MSDLPGVVLAGGQATRMGGGDKGLLDLNGRSLLARVIDRLSPQVSGMALNANGDASRFAAYGLPVLPDSVPGHPGPLAGVLAGLDWAAAEGAAAIITAAADTPFFPTELAARLQAATADMAAPLALAASPDGRQPTFGIWPTALREELRTALQGGLRRIVAWTDRHQGRQVLFETPGEPFFNVNTAEDLSRALGMPEAQL